MMVRRRAILQSAVALAAGRLAYSDLASAAASAPAPSQPFDYAWLKGQARKLGGNAYQASQDTLPPAMAKLSYDQFQSLRFRSDRALWAKDGLAFRLQFFHVGRSFTEPVRLYEVIDGQSREIIYDPAMFEFDKAGIDPKLMRGHQGFAGFRVQFVTDWRDDIAAYLGASYFRAVGSDTRQYGLSAGEGFRNSDPVRAAGFAEHRRRPALSDRAGRHASHGHRQCAVSAQTHRTLGRGPAHQHVLLRRERPARRE
jgi:periplasmic glucans biosynthesis protein